jgi:hypothetical protein
MKNKYKDPEILQLFWNYRKTILLLSSIGAIASVIVSFLLPVQFKSAVVMYPSTVGSVSKSLIEPSPGDDFLAYGSEQNAEHLLQFLESAKVKGFITQKHDLFNHYQLNEGIKLRETKLNKQYQQNFKFRRTKLGSIIIEVYDKNPQKAADMANDVAAFADSVRNEINRSQAQKALTILSKEINNLNKNLKQVEDSLSYLRGLGLVDYKAQAPIIAASIGSTEKNKSNLVNVFATYGGTFTSLLDLQEHLVEQLALYKARRDIVAMDADAIYNYSFIVDRAYPAEVKTKPIRWLVVSATTMATFFFSLIWVLVIFRIRQLKTNATQE